MFSAFGNILSCKIAVDGSAQSKGYGFVQYDTEEAAQKAIDKLNGMLLNDKSVYVGAFLRKQERDMSSDKAQFSQLRPIAIAPSVAPRMPMYLPGGPGLGQQIFYGQGPPAIMPPQPGFGYQQQLVPGMRPGGGGMPNFFVPMVQQGQRPGGRRGGAGPLQQPQQPIPLMPQQVLPRGGRMYRYHPGRNMQEGPMPGVDGGMLSIPYDMAGIPMRKLF